MPLAGRVRFDGTGEGMRVAEQIAANGGADPIQWQPGADVGEGVIEKGGQSVGRNEGHHHG